MGSRTLLLALLTAGVSGASAQSSQPAPRPEHAESRRFNTALGVECAHCHTPDRWADAGKPPFTIARDMMAMVREINARLAPRRPIGCITCHGGQTRPSRQPRERLDAELAKWPAGVPEDRKLWMAVYNVTLGVGCEHCHDAGDWKNVSETTARTIADMTALFDIFPKYMPASARTQCFMCHKGSTRPRR